MWGIETQKKDEEYGTHWFSNLISLALAPNGNLILIYI